jgi:hypothetical protein
MWLEHLTDHYEIATVPGSMPAASDTVESEGAADEEVLNNVHKKSPYLTITIKSIISLAADFVDRRIQRITLASNTKKN